MKILCGSGMGFLFVGVMCFLAALVSENKDFDKTKWFAGSACIMLAGIGEIVIALAIKLIEF